MNANYKFISLKYFQLLGLACTLSLMSCADSKLEEVKARTAELQRLTSESKARTDKARTGGQPGQISISFFESEESAVAEKIIISSVPGKGFDGKTPELAKDSVQLIKLTEQQFDEKLTAGWLTRMNLLVNFGCDKDLVEKYSNKDTVVYNGAAIVPDLKSSSLGSYNIHATTILLCHSDELQGRTVNLTAVNVVLNSFKYKVHFTLDPLGFTFFNIASMKLILMNQNRLISKRRSTAFPFDPVSGFRILTKKIEGTGRLEINSLGTDAL